MRQCYRNGLKPLTIEVQEADRGNQQKQKPEARHRQGEIKPPARRRSAPIPRTIYLEGSGSKHRPLHVYKLVATINHVGRCRIPTREFKYSHIQSKDTSIPISLGRGCTSDEPSTRLSDGWNRYAAYVATLRPALIVAPRSDRDCSLSDGAQEKGLRGDGNARMVEKSDLCNPLPKNSAGDGVLSELNELLRNVDEASPLLPSPHSASSDNPTSGEDFMNVPIALPPLEERGKPKLRRRLGRLQ